MGAEYCYVTPACLQLSIHPVSTSQVLGLQLCAPTLNSSQVFWNSLSVLVFTRAWQLHNPCAALKSVSGCHCLCEDLVLSWGLRCLHGQNSRVSAPGRWGAIKTGSDVFFVVVVVLKFLSTTCKPVWKTRTYCEPFVLNGFRENSNCEVGQSSVPKVALWPEHSKGELLKPYALPSSRTEECTRAIS